MAIFEIISDLSFSNNSGLQYNAIANFSCKYNKYRFEMFE